MAELDILKLVVQFGEAGLFLWLFLRLDERLVKLNERHDTEMREMRQEHNREMQQSYNRWLDDIRNMARLPTDLEPQYKMGPDSRVKA
jgi:hypothetical protein